MKPYTWLECWFANRWQWVRRRSRSRWLMRKDLGHFWVKIEASPNLMRMAYRVDLANDALYVFEDWR